MDTRRTIKRLREAGEIIDGVRCIGAVELARLMGERPQHIARWEKQGHLRRVVVPMPRRVPYLRGYRVLYRVEDAIAQIERRRANRLDMPWSRHDEQILRERYGIDTCESIAAMLKRSPMAVRHKAHYLGLDLRQHLIEHHRLLTVTELARLMRRTHRSVAYWVSRGMPVAKLRPTRTGVRLFNLPEVLAWMRTQPSIAMNTPRDVRLRLNLPLPGEQEAA